MESEIRKTFDREFFDRFYRREKTAVISLADVCRLVRFVMSYLDFLEVPVDTVLDAGCGLGHWQTALHRLGRRPAYTGIDVSEYLCRRYGWRRCNIADFRSRSMFDLIVCQDVLQYASDNEARGSIRNIARLCRGALYFDVPTREDVESGALDMTRTDPACHLRSAAWYRRQLHRHFIGAGGGLFIPKTSQTVVLALESV